ncbi:MAG: aminotransferase class V-fold PLP-dependent enzyme [Candidatus Eiseniibacteriota bacterium]
MNAPDSVMHASPARTFGRAMRGEWMLDPAVSYLNHGTVGAVPRRVLAVQQAIRDEIERQPARFMLRELADTGEIVMSTRPRMRLAAAAVAEFLGSRGEDLMFVDNATAGVSSVLRSIKFSAGDEIVITDHVYGAVGKAARFVAAGCGAVVKPVDLPGPPFEPAGMAQAIDSACSDRTRLLIVDHITSGTALVFPLRDIVARAKRRGIAVLVDGAHAPGAIDLDLSSLGADWYTGNLHKWAMAPRSSGLLWVAPERQTETHPAVLSWGLGHGLAAEFDLTGTRDATPWLAAPAGIEFMQSLGLDAMRAYNHAFAWNAARTLCERWGTTLPAAESMYGSMVTFPLPPRMGTAPGDATRLKDAMLFEENIEVQIHAWKGTVWMRICGQVYNDADDLERLIRGIEKLTRR